MCSCPTFGLQAARVQLRSQLEAAEDRAADALAKLRDAEGDWRSKHRQLASELADATADAAGSKQRLAGNVATSESVEELKGLLGREADAVAKLRAQLSKSVDVELAGAQLVESLRSQLAAADARISSLSEQLRDSVRGSFFLVWFLVFLKKYFGGEAFFVFLH